MSLEHYRTNIICIFRSLTPSNTNFVRTCCTSLPSSKAAPAACLWPKLSVSVKMWAINALQDLQKFKSRPQQYLVQLPIPLHDLICRNKFSANKQKWQYVKAELRQLWCGYQYWPPAACSALFESATSNRVIRKCPPHIWGKDYCGKARMEPTWKVEKLWKKRHQRFGCYLYSNVVKVYIASSILIMWESPGNVRPGLWNGHEQSWAARNERCWSCGLRFIVFDIQITSISS